MFNEEEGIIHYEVESDDSLELVEDIPFIQEPPKEQPKPQPQVEQPSQHENTSTLTHVNEDKLDEEQMLRRPYALKWKKKTLKKLEKITDKLNDQDLDREIQEQVKKKVVIQQTPTDVIISGSKSAVQMSIPLHKQKEFQLMIEHCAGRPDFMEAIMAEQQQREYEQLQAEGGNIAKKSLIVPPKSGLKKQPGRKKANVTFDETAKLPGQIQYIKTSVLPEKQPPPPAQPTQQIQSIISKFQEYRESQVQIPTQQPQQQQEQSQLPLGQGQWYNSKADKKTQPFMPPHAGSNPKQIPTISSVQMLSQQQAAQQSLPHKYLNQNQTRRELSPKRTRDMITEQYTSAYQVDRPPQLPSRQQPVFQQQQIEKNMIYEQNQAKKMKEQQYGISQQQSNVKIQAKLQESVKRQSVPAPTVEEDDQDLIDDDVIESQSFIDFKRAGKLIDTAPPTIQYWQQVSTNMDIPQCYYMNGKFEREQSNQTPSNDPYELMKLFMDSNICKYICQTSNKGQCIKIDEDILESFITALIYLFYIQLMGVREVKRTRFDFILDNATFKHICKEIRIDEFEDYSYIFDKIAQNFKTHYSPEEFLMLDTPIFYQNHYIEGLISLSDGMKGYILDFIYGIDNKKINRSLQKYQGKHHKLFLGPQVSQLDLMTQLKLKQFGSLARVVGKESQLTQEQIQQIKLNSIKGQSSQFISNDLQIVMLIYGQRQQHLHQIEGIVSSYADFTLLQKKDTNVAADVNKPIIVFLYDRIKTAYDRRAKTYAFSQIPEQDFNQHLEVFIQLLYSSIFNSNVLYKIMSPNNQSKQQLLDFVRTLLHTLYVRNYKRKGITSFAASHTLVDNPVQLNCSECGELSLFICNECSEHQQMMIPICRNKNEACLKTHQEIFISQPVFSGAAKKLTNKQAIVQLEFYRSQIRQSGQKEFMTALPLLEEALTSLENQSPDESITTELQTLMNSLQRVVSSILKKPNILVPKPSQDPVPQFQRLQGKVVQQ